MITLTINGQTVQAEENQTILEAAHAAGIYIPTLCYLKDINEISSCRICVVEVAGRENLVPACSTLVKEGMEIQTENEKIISYRKELLKLILKKHDLNCFSCVRNHNCELQTVCHMYGLEETEEGVEQRYQVYELDESAPHLVRNNNKCIGCHRCVGACEKVQKIGVIHGNHYGHTVQITSPQNLPLWSTACVACGQCIAVCPVGAIYEKDQVKDVLKEIRDPEKFVIVQTAPAVRAALGEAFGLPVGTDVEGKMAAALRKIGFDKVFDTNFSADLTIMEEANEFIERVQNGGVLPLITSCSPGWVKYCEHYYPEMTENLSSCKSPQQMFGAVAKSYYAEKMGIDKEKMVVVSIMPCTAKKFEVTREEMNANGVPDVDYALTTRELARMIKMTGVPFMALEDEEFDMPLGLGTGAAVIFGATGGVMEAALRTAVEKLTGEELKELNFTDVRGVQGIKEATYNVAGMDVKVAVASGLGNARELLDRVKSGEANYHFIEIMGCPGGCVNGGGQPNVPAKIRNFTDIRAERAKVLYNIDANNPIRKSHENPAIIEIYDTYLGQPGSEKAHHLLHTTYVKRGL